MKIIMAKQDFSHQSHKWKNDYVLQQNLKDFESYLLSIREIKSASLKKNSSYTGNAKNSAMLSVIRKHVCALYITQTWSVFVSLSLQNAKVKT